ncbi:MAG TPA: circadian clock KaiB family protein [Tepidisphaeraceae bacterium]|jgi:circadian clock protein KaiB|nr:circadian clock KaiB family protein [Tepidisphaeraceae bacterium]
MSHARRARRKRGKEQRGHYFLRLFVVGDGPNSKQALANLRSLCREHLDGRYTIETIDVEKNFKAAARDNILITPALILVAPLPRVTVLGNLSDRQKVLLALRLLGGDS